MFAKVFRVVTGYEVVKGHVTYGAGLVVDVERGESIEVFPAQQGGASSPIGRFSYDELESSTPPRGLAAVA